MYKTEIKFLQLTIMIKYGSENGHLSEVSLHPNVYIRIHS